MTEKKQVYKCKVCGNIVEVLENGAGELVCCNQPMELQKEQTNETPNEKHVPVIERTEQGYLIKVGIVEHPMSDDHYIQWIELIVDDVSYIKTLKPTDKPIVEFSTPHSKDVTARAYCNLHGFWKSVLAQE